MADETVKGGLAERLKPILRSAAPPVFWVQDRAQYPYIQSLGLAFLQGANAEYYAPNTTSCFNRTLYDYYFATVTY